ncbi:hypothetical protein A3765_08495 [Oleiphilus sp. HI0130]|nr:hypothetical protein A3765_08495 [Oleiphilus sp. HI0130]
MLGARLGSGARLSIRELLCLVRVQGEFYRMPRTLQIRHPQFIYLSRRSAEAIGWPNLIHQAALDQKCHAVPHLQTWFKRIVFYTLKRANTALRRL